MKKLEVNGLLKTYAKLGIPLDEQKVLAGVVAVDAVGAGTGDLVLYATGSSARQTELTQDKPCDAVAMAVIDSWDLGGENVYEKWA